MQRVKTPLTDLLGIDAPLIVPPMAGVTGGKLAAEVTLAGGFGLVGVAFDEEACIREIEIAKSILGTSPDQPLNLGVGFLGWILEKKPQVIKALDYVLEQRIKCIWLSFGNDLGRWINYIRKYDESRDKPHKTLIWVVVSSVEEAQRATTEWHADVLVVQGIEAGGHGHSEALPLMTLLPMVKQSISNPPPLVAAGGIANGAQIASLLVLGAAAAVVGTRYAATHESTYSPNQKGAVIASTHSVRTVAFDIVRGTNEWPKGIDGRAIPNLVLEDEAKGFSMEERQRLYDEATKKDDVSRRVVWSGASVGLVKEIVGAAALTRTLQKEVVEQLNLARSLLN